MTNGRALHARTSTSCALLLWVVASCEGLQLADIQLDSGMVDPEVVAFLDSRADIHDLLHTKPGGGMARYDHQHIWMLSTLKREVLDSGRAGAIVELGVFKGNMAVLTSLVISRFGDRSRITHHVYDSFKGFPEGDAEDIGHGRLPRDPKLLRGRLNGSYSVPGFVSAFRARNTPEPVMHRGFFADIPDDDYPTPIVFAFLDGDLYRSITDSLDKIYHKCVRGAPVFIHDVVTGDPSEMMRSKAVTRVPGPKTTRWRGPAAAIQRFFGKSLDQVVDKYLWELVLVRGGLPRDPHGAY